MKLTVNAVDHEVDVEPEMPLLWVLRDELGITGPKYGCGMAQCGACTVHLDGAAVRSCSVPVGTVKGKVTTIEGLGRPDALHAVQKAWIDHQVAQCGYCQSGQIMSAAAFLSAQPNPTDEQMHPEVQVEIHTSDRPGQELHQFGVPAVPEDPARHRMVRLRTPGTRLHAICLVNPGEGGRSIEVTPAWSVISNDDETAYQAALAGAGLTLLPELALTARIHGGQLRRVLAPWISADGLKLVATMPSRRFLPLRTRAFLEFFVRHVQNVAAMAGSEPSPTVLSVA